jgi:histone deacetylase 11
MRLAVTGTMLATELALTGHSIVINLAGGYHHAFSDHGEGFCIYADLAVAVAASRAHGTLRPGDTIAIIDLDAHRGNGTWKLFESDKTVQILDIHNFQNYPGMFPGDCDAYPFQIPVKAHTPDSCYLALIRQELPKLCASAQPKN